MEDKLQILKDNNSTKRIHYLDLTGKTSNWSESKGITFANCSQEQFEKFNLRHAEDNEIIIDIEEPERYDEVKRVLDKLGWKYNCYFTGSRGFHFVITFEDLNEFTDDDRRKIRTVIINAFESDTRFYKPLQWKCVEGRPHIKTGKVSTFKCEGGILCNVPNDVIMSSKNVRDNNNMNNVVSEVTNKYKDAYKDDQIIQYCMNNQVPNGERNNALFLNLACLLVNSNATDDEINDIINRIVANCPGKTSGEFYGWINKARNGEISEHNIYVMNTWIRMHNIRIPEYIYNIDIDVEMNTINELKSQIAGLLLEKKEEQATEVITEYIKNTHFVYTTMDDVQSEIWFYSDGIYKPNGKSKIKEITRTLLIAGYTPQRVNKIIAKIEADTYIEQKEFFEINYIKEMPVKNGILNLETLELTEFTPKKIFFNKLPLIYDKDAKCPKIDKFFKDVLADKSDVDVIYELFGYCLWKNHFIEKGFMFNGKGRNGKGKTISLIKTFLGAENCCSIPLNEMVSGSTGICELFGRLTNLSGDLDDFALKKIGLLKMILGRDIIAAKRKYLRDLFFTNYSKQIFACNTLPKVYDTTDGFWDKWVLLDFPYKFISQNEYDNMNEKDRQFMKVRDEDIINRITSEEEMSGLLNEAIIGLHRLFKNRDFSCSKGTKDIKDTWVRRSDSFMAFCLDNLEESDDNNTLSKKEVRKRYQKYIRDHKLKGTSDIAIKITLETLFCIGSTQLGDGEYYWEGIKWLN